MSSLNGGRVLIFQQRGWGITIGHAVAKRLQELGCHLAALTIKKGTHDFVISQKDVLYELIVSGDEVKEDPAKFLGEEDFSLAKICEDLGIKSIWPLVQSMRNHVKCYADKYYYGFKQNRPDEEIVVYVKAIYKNIKRVFTLFNPEIIVAPNFVALQHVMFNLYARKRNIEMIGVSDSKVSGVFYFSYGYLEDRGPFQDRFEELNDGATSDNVDRARDYLMSFRQSFIAPQRSKLSGAPTSTREKVKAELRPYVMCVRYYMKKMQREQSKLGVTLDTLSPRYIMRDHFARKNYVKCTEGFPYYDFEKVEKYVYFPLQFQPEATIDVQSPRCNNQIETARQVAMSLPGDYTLVVKEHPSMVGYRPPSYLEKVARTPNVKLIDFRVPIERVLQRASLVVAPGGTVLAEAAILKIPAIQLGQLGKTLLLPNVFRHTDLSTLASKIVEVLSIDLDTSEYEQGLINYVAAMYDVGLESNYVEIWEGTETDGLHVVVERFVSEIAEALNGRNR